MEPGELDTGTGSGVKQCTNKQCSHKGKLLPMSDFIGHDKGMKEQCNDCRETDAKKKRKQRKRRSEVDDREADELEMVSTGVCSPSSPLFSEVALRLIEERIRTLEVENAALRAENSRLLHYTCPTCHTPRQDLCDDEILAQTLDDMDDLYPAPALPHMSAEIDELVSGAECPTQHGGGTTEQPGRGGMDGSSGMDFTMAEAERALAALSLGGELTSSEAAALAGRSIPEAPVPVTQLGESTDNQCPICLDDFTDPLQLPCKHMICALCLRQMQEKGVQNACPLCRAELHPGPEVSFSDGCILCIRAQRAEGQFKVDMLKQGVGLCQAAADQGYAAAQYNLAFCYHHGDGVERDMARAVGLYQAAADQGYAASQCNLGICYHHGDGVERDMARAVGLYQAAADQGCAAAQRNLGVCYHDGDGVERDMARAVGLYQAAADQGYAAAQCYLAVCYANGVGVERDMARAVGLYQAAADQGHDAAQCSLGFCYANGIGVERDMARAVGLYQAAADQGHAAAQDNLAFCYVNGVGVERDMARAVGLYQAATDQGHAAAQCYLGICYEHGDGVEQDMARAVGLYQAAADQGHDAAQYNLGICYANGVGVEQDMARAVGLYQAAADQGCAASQYNLGICYHNGDGVEQDTARAVGLYQAAADQGYAAAQYNLGAYYEHDIGVERDMARAVGLYQAAADQGYAAAQYNLGVCYANGDGVERDMARAVGLYQAAADQGHAAAQCSEIRQGTSVRLHGLVSAAEHNGKLGQVVGPMDAIKGRYPIALCGEERQLGLKADNLLQNIRVKHRTHGTLALIVAKDDASEMYKIEECTSGAMSSWPYGDTVIPKGTCVKVINLTGAVQWNGCRGTIVNMNTETGRYGVQMDQVDRIAVKFNRVSL